MGARPRIAQLDVLAQADAFITHGGANGVMEGLLAGVPLIVVPFVVDQFSNGEAVERAGAGVTFPDFMGSKPGVLVQAAETALLGEVGEAQRVCSRQLGEALRHAGGTEAAVEACIEAFGSLSLECRRGGA